MFQQKKHVKKSEKGEVSEYTSLVVVACRSTVKGDRDDSKSKRKKSSTQDLALFDQASLRRDFVPYWDKVKKAKEIYRT